MTLAPQVTPQPRDRIVSVAEMRAIEQAADAHGHSFAAMMEEAGAAVATAIADRASFPPPRVLVIVGPGNNGGDGLVCAWHLHRQGFPVRVYLWQRRTDPEHDYERHSARVTAAGIECFHAGDDPDQTTLATWLRHADVVVDALLGTGSNRPIKGTLATLLDTVRAEASRRPLAICAVDCPSGLDCDSGALDVHAVPAAWTVTFAHAKRGHYLFPGAAACGEVVVVDIGIEPALVEGALGESGATFALTRDAVSAWLPARARASHKGTFGKVMVVAGSTPYPGAAALATGAAGRVGAGLVTGAVPEAIWHVVAAQRLEATWLPLPTTDGALDPVGAAIVQEAMDGYDALVLGCGLTQRPGAQRFVEELLREPSLPPTLIDADGLNCLAHIDGWQAHLPAACVLTPHPAELARLLGESTATVLEFRWELTRAAAARWKTVIVAKGPYTVVAAPDGRLAVLPIATASLATAGTGDVLSGAIGGLLAQGLQPFAAACVGVWLHGRAGLLLEEEIGLAGTLAGDLLVRLPRVISPLRDDEPDNFPKPPVL